METTWRERRRFEARLLEGESLTSQDTKRLIDDADVGERAEAVLGALEEAMRAQLGIVVLNATTDDDREIRIELIQAEGENS